MTNIENIKSMLEKNGGIITATQVTSAGIPRRCLTELVDNNIIYKVERGIYALPEVWEDEMYILQYRFSKGIFSHDTALYLHGLSDRTPMTFTMTFPHGYNATSVKKENTIVKLAITGIYELGITHVPSPCGNMLKTYDIEKTLCDIVKGKNTCDIQIVNQAMKVYASSKIKNINKLFDYAERLRVKSKVMSYMGVLL